METSDIALYGGIAIVVLVALVTGLSATNIVNAGGEPEYKVICTGNVKVSFFGAFNEPDLDPEPSCKIQQCGLFTLSISNPLFLGESGNLRLVVDGIVQDTKGFSTSFSSDEKYTLSTSCLSKPSRATVELYNDNEVLVDTWTGGLQ